MGIYLGFMILSARKERGWTQAQLAQPMNMSIEDIKICEKGFYDLSVVKLYQFSKALEVPIEFFFEGLYEDYDVLKINHGPNIENLPVTKET